MAIRGDPNSPLAGVNGIATRNGWVYLTNSERALLRRCPLTSTDPATDLEVVAERHFADDLDLGPAARRPRPAPCPAADRPAAHQ